MEKTVRSAVCLLLCLVICLSCAGSAFSAGGDEIRIAKKVISVVFDDSGSMMGERWVYTNYAMQALAALLNEQDSLYITFMSQPFRAQELDLSDTDAVVRQIRGFTYSGNTPEAAINTARSQLDQIGVTDKTTQFWLLVMTDGAIEDDAKFPMQEKLEGYAGNSMSNGSALNVVYLGMGSSADVRSVPSKGLYAFRAEDNGSICAAMSELANLVSGRFPARDLKQKDDYTVSFSSALPLYSISVLSQNSAATVSSVTADGTELSRRNVTLDASDPKSATRTRVSGNAAVAYSADGAGVGRVIPAGTYTIRFSEPVELSQLTVQYEPAIGLKAVVSRSGKAVSDPDSLSANDSVDITLVPVVPGTDEEIPEKDLPAGIEWAIELEHDGQLVRSESGRSLKGVSVLTGSNLIRGTMMIPGFAPLVYELSVDLRDFWEDLSIVVEQPSDLSYDRADLRGKKGGAALVAEKGGVLFRICSDGTPLTAEQLKSSGIQLQVAETSVENRPDWGGKIKVHCSVKQNGDGSYSLIPGARIPFGLGPFIIMAGDYTVLVSVAGDDSVTAVGSFRVNAKPSDWQMLPWFIATVLLLALIAFNLFRKSKFSGQVVFKEQYKISTSEQDIPASDSITLGPLTGLHFFRLKKYSWTSFHGMELRASGGNVLVTGASIAANAVAYGFSSDDPGEYADSIVEQLNTTRGENGEILTPGDVVLGPIPLWFREEGSGYIWCLKL